MNSDYIPPAFYLLVIIALVAEVVWARRSGRTIYTTRETLANVGVAVMNRIGTVAAYGLKVAMIAFFARFALWNLPTNAVTVAVGFLTVEVAYYWYHRLSHTNALLWSLHNVHHSSPEYNLTIAPRLNFLGNFVSALWFAPLALLGFDEAIIYGSLAVGLFYQYFLHTQAIPKLGALEGWLNTPSAHRVHHGSNALYIDRNYAAILAVLDRAFGSYQPEVEPVRYGVTTGHYGYNPLKLTVGPLIQWVTRRGWMRERNNVDRAQSERSQLTKTDAR